MKKQMSVLKVPGFAYVFAVCIVEIGLSLAPSVLCVVQKVAFLFLAMLVGTRVGSYK